jgi:hypothetical protein
MDTTMELEELSGKECDVMEGVGVRKNGYGRMKISVK